MTKVFCDVCKKEFLLQSVDIKELVMDSKSQGLHYVYKYFECPHCKEVYTVSIDDYKSLELEKEFLSVKIRVEKLRKKGKLTEDKIRLLQKKQDKLRMYRQKLIDVYSKVFTEIAKQNSDKIINAPQQNVEKEET